MNEFTCIITQHLWHAKQNSENVLKTCSLLCIIETAICVLKIFSGDSKESAFVYQSCLCEVPLRELRLFFYSSIHPWNLTLN